MYSKYTSILPLTNSKDVYVYRLHLIWTLAMNRLQYFLGELYFILLITFKSEHSILFPGIEHIKIH
jgi:hypothetical protein